jgi:hypothetical protein
METLNLRDWQLALISGQLSGCIVAGTTTDRVLIAFRVNLYCSESPISIGIR